MFRSLLLAGVLAPQVAAALPTAFVSTADTGGDYGVIFDGSGPILSVLSVRGTITGAPAGSGYVGGDLRLDFGPEIFDRLQADPIEIGRISLRAAGQPPEQASYVVISSLDDNLFGVEGPVGNVLELPFVFDILSYVGGTPFGQRVDVDLAAPDDNGTPSDGGDDLYPLETPLDFLGVRDLGSYLGSAPRAGTARIFFDGSIPLTLFETESGRQLPFADGPLDVTRIELDILGAPAAVPAPIPLPAGGLALLLGLGSLAMVRRRTR